MKDALRQGRLTPTGVRSMIYLIAEKSVELENTDPKRVIFNYFFFT